MKYNDPELRQKLASEYVLGTLHGRARARFERLLRNDARLRDEVAAWQTRLMPLADAVPPVNPPPRVWRNIQTRLGMHAVSRWSLTFWRNLGLVSTAAALMLAVYIAIVPLRTPALAYVALINDTQAKPAWVVSASGSQLTIKSLAPRTLAANQSLQLWLLPTGGKPVSLGLMPLTGSKTAALPIRVSDQFAHAPAVAISLEPAGGSPTGQPTGPVLYQGPLVTT
ncbi:MAG: anti-sigma factor [Pseudomonadota bacterium]